MMGKFIGLHFNYYAVITLVLLGLWGMVAHRNLIKKTIGLAIFQNGIILFFVSMGAKKGASIPIIQTDPHSHAPHQAIEAAAYANPLTQILMLTAIVVGVATIGVALTLIQKIHQEYGTTEEHEILEKLK